jgi:hypothetical protein
MTAARALDAAELRAARAVCVGGLGLDLFGVEDDGLPPAAVVAAVAADPGRLAEVIPFPVASRHRTR